MLLRLCHSNAWSPRLSTTLLSVAPPPWESNLGEQSVSATLQIVVIVTCSACHCWTVLCRSVCKMDSDNEVLACEVLVVRIAMEEENKAKQKRCKWVNKWLLYGGFFSELCYCAWKTIFKQYLRIPLSTFRMLLESNFSFIPILVWR